MEHETKTELNRLDDDFIEMKTNIVEKLSNQEFYDMYANMKIKATQNKNQITQNENQIVMMHRQNEVIGKQVDNMEKMAKDCEARIPSKPKEDD